MMTKCGRWLAMSFVMIVLALTTIVACPEALADANIVHVSGALEEDTTWDANTVYVVDADLTVSQGVTLTVPSGTVVKFGQYADLVVEGRLALGDEPIFHYVYLPMIRSTNASDTASGRDYGPTLASMQLSAVPPVILTSITDDTAGGDTNANGDASTPTMGDWGGIVFEDASLDSSYMQAFEIRYSGVPREYRTCGAIVLVNASPYLAQGSFADNQIDGIEIGHANWLSDVWDARGIVYHVTDDVTVPRGNSLTILPGTIVKVTRHERLIVKGGLHAIGTADKPVIMTSWRDTQAGGATFANAEGDPEKKDWGGIEFAADSAAYHSALDHVELRYTGYGLLPDRAAIQLHNCSPHLGTITFVEGYYHGASLQASDDTLTSLTLASQTVPYIISNDLIVPRHETLSLEPGVVLKLRPSKSLRIEGALDAQGTPFQHVLFTSLYDDTALGDTDNGGSTPAPNPGDWGSVSYEPGSDDSECRMDCVTLRYGGSDGIDFTTVMGPLRIDNAAPTLSRITLEDNKLNALTVAPGAWSSTTWHNAGVVYFVRDDVTFLPGQVLSVAPGVVVKILNPIAPTDQPLITVQGALQVGAIGAQPVTITSGRDDDSGPANVDNWDSNGDGTATAPDINNWKGISMETGADGASSYLRNAIVKYGGLHETLFVDPHGALQLNSVSFPIEGCQFLDNYRGVEALDGATPTISGSSFVGNNDYGVYNGASESVTVLATNNWWGDITGPASDGQGCNAATGYGDKVSCGVTFAPWLAVEP